MAGWDGHSNLPGGVRVEPARRYRQCQGGRTKKRLEGEELVWYKLAFHLKRTVEELANAITYSEFLKWVQILEVEETWRNKQEHYLAMIAAEVRKSYVKFPNKVKTEDMFLVVKTNNGSETDWKARMAKSKSVWGAALGPNLQRKESN